MNFEVEITGDGQLAKQVQQAASLAMEYTASDVWAGIRKKAPVDHGRLAGSFQMDRAGELSWMIHTAVHYALYVHNGTGIYGEHGTPIVPRTAGALKFFWKKTGRMMVFKGDLQSSGARASFGNWAEERGMSPVFAWVKGMEARPFANWAIEDTEKRIEEFVRRAINETQ